jgi:glycosyltransferase involved in cell wall biosynthesis
MNLLVYAIDFTPLIGGEETFLLNLGGVAERDRAIRMTMATRTPAGSFDDSVLPFRVVRRPGMGALWRLVGAADVVHLSGPVLSVLLMGWLRRKPVVVSHHLYHSACPNGLLVRHPDDRVCDGAFLGARYGECVRCNAGDDGWGKSVLRLMATFPRRWLCGRIAANVAVTEHVARRIALPRTRTIQHGIRDRENDVGRRPPARDRREFAYVGRLVKEKGLIPLLRALKRLSLEGLRFRLSIIGDGPQRAAAERETADLGLQDRVSFVGPLEGRELEAALGGVSALVMPSTWEETAGLAAIEHMMRGGVVVAADIGGLAEVVGQAGIRFPPGDESALAAALRKVLEDPGAGSELGRLARERALERFSGRRMVDDYIALYRGVAG